MIQAAVTHTILIVDDQPSDLLILNEAVHDLGNVHIASNGNMALEIARQCRPDLILLDIQMPDMDGFQLCRAIKADPKLCDAAILFVTAQNQTENEIKALEYGGIDFIDKPLNIPVIRGHVRAHLNLRLAAKRLAYYDDLTGLPNRSLLQDRAEQALQTAHRNQSKVALLLLDLDNFKIINDSVDHSVGDAVLAEIGSRLTQFSRGIDTVSRQGGDEFVILLPEVKRLDAIGDLVERMLAVIATPMYINKKRYDLTASAGVGVFPDDSQDFASLYRHADTAMYQAKKLGRNRYRFFSQGLENSSRARHLLEGHMRSALEHGVFEVFYQAKYDAQKKNICGMEALIRWRKADGSLISPADFIPLAEETGLIVPIGKYVLLQACNDAQRLQLLGFAIPVSVNISAVQFREESFLEMVKDALEQSTLPPTMLELEITEGVLAHDIVMASDVLNELKAMGVHIAIDDFGTGYSSLAYLKSLPIDVLKIDQSFVRDMLTDSSDAAIIEAIIRMAQALGLSLIAEGVEEIEQSNKLLAFGCPVMQGYLYCRPMPFNALCEFLNTTASVNSLLTENQGSHR
ncbi:putative bifunctional diguanylate cyclase/phosphodiesterase [Pseudomonas leptonychotis]|uniref:putative bifunctional diguanylate cyclase/phosphodiesterase n=1 Tax=Pseudomonas leptonychotis TaxID=2448482 RepID=UPI0039F0010B